jgi:hypothetical protein
MPPVSPSVTHLPPHPTHNRLVSLLPSLFRGYPTSGIPRHVSLGQLSPSREYPWSSNPDIFDAASSAVELDPNDRSGAGPAPAAGCLLPVVPVGTGARPGTDAVGAAGAEDEEWIGGMEAEVEELAAGRPVGAPSHRAQNWIGSFLPARSA